MVLLRPETREVTLAHELMHWDDFESPTFDRAYASRAKRLANASYLSEDQKAFLESAIREVRGHAAGERHARLSGQQRLPMLDRAGGAVPAADLVAAHEFEAANQVNGFLQNYRRHLTAIGETIKETNAADFKAFVDLVSHFNLAPATSRLASPNLLAGLWPSGRT